MTLAAFLRDMFPPTPTIRPAGNPNTWTGTWYADGNIPH